MGFNFGVFAGGLNQGAQQTLATVKQYRDMADQAQDRAAKDQLRTDLAATPQVGDGKYAIDPSKANPDMGPPQTTKTGSVSQADQDQYVRQALVRAGQYDAASKMRLQGSQADYYGANAEGKGIDNKLSSNVLQASKDATTFYQTGVQKIMSGDIPGALSDLAARATQTGTKYGVSQDGKTWTVDGQSYDVTNPHTVGALYGAMQNHILLGALQQADPTKAPAVAQANAQTQQAASGALDANSRARLVPSEINRNNGAANASNADATTAPAKIDNLKANANASNATADYHGELTHGLKVTNGVIDKVSELPSEAFAPDANGVVKADPLVRQAAAVKNPGGVYSADKATERNEYSNDTKSDISDNQIASGERKAQWANATKEATAQIRATAKSGGIAGQNWVEDKNAFGRYHDSKSGAILQIDPKTNKITVLKQPDAVGGIQPRMVLDKNGNRVPGYPGAGGQLYDNAVDAASSLGKSGVVPTAQNPNGAGQIAALPNMPR
jgi:hypothetical protein